MGDNKYYKMKHVPTGLYYQPHKHGGSHLSKKGKIYQTNTNGVESDNYGHSTFTVWCEKDSQIYKLTTSLLFWKNSRSNQVVAETNFQDWIREYI